MMKKRYSCLALGGQRLAWLRSPQPKQAAVSPDPKPRGPSCLPRAGSPSFAPCPGSESSEVLLVSVLLTFFFSVRVCLSALPSSLSPGVLLSPFLDLIKGRRQGGHTL